MTVEFITLETYRNEDGTHDTIGKHLAYDWWPCWPRPRIGKAGHLWFEWLPGIKEENRKYAERCRIGRTADR